MSEMTGFLPDTSASANRALVPPISPTSARSFVCEPVMCACPASGVKLRGHELRVAAQRRIAREPSHLGPVEACRDHPRMSGGVEMPQKPRIGDDGYPSCLSGIEEHL